MREAITLSPGCTRGNKSNRTHQRPLTRPIDETHQWNKSNRTQRSSEAIRGHQRQLTRLACTEGHWGQSLPISGNQRQSETIRETIRGHQRQFDETRLHAREQIEKLDALGTQHAPPSRRSRIQRALLHKQEPRRGRRRRAMPSVAPSVAPSVVPSAAFASENARDGAAHARVVCEVLEGGVRPPGGHSPGGTRHVRVGKQPLTKCRGAAAARAEQQGCGQAAPPRLVSRPLSFVCRP